MPAEHGKAGDDVVARFEMADAGPDRFDHPGRLVPENERYGEGDSVAVQGVEVAVTDSGCHRLDQHLAEAGLTDLDITNHGRTRHGFHDCCSHTPSLSRSWRVCPVRIRRRRVEAGAATVGCFMANKSGTSREAKKSGKSLKEKRVAKQEKVAAAEAHRKVTDR